MADQESAAKWSRNDPTTYNILFVCTGNTCRSPMAMAIARDAVRRRGWTHVSVASAGIAAGGGAGASEGAARAAAEAGLDLSDHAARPLTPELVEWADVILTMSPSHLSAVASLGGGEKAALVTDFVQGEGAGLPVEDPFGGDDEAYRIAFRQLRQAIDAVLARLEPILAP